MALQDQLHTIECGTGDVIGSGTLGCPFNPDTIAGFWALKAGTKITEELSRDTVRTLQKEGKLIPLPNAYDVTWENEEDPVTTSPTRGYETKTRDGLYKMTALFDNGVFFQKVLKSMEGSGRWDLILFDDSENLMGTSMDNTYLSGFKTSRFSVNPIVLGGENSGKASLTVQFAKSNEINKYFTPIASEVLEGFFPSEIDGANHVRLTYMGGLTDTSTSITVKTVLAMGNSQFVGGLSANDFLVRVEGETVTPSDVTENPLDKTYTLTVTALEADQTVKTTLYDASNNSGIIEVGTEPEEVLYTSDEIVAVVEA